MQNDPRHVPWRELEALFLDAGNTLVSIDFEWVSRELAGRGVGAAPAELRRAEAAARPPVSRKLVERGTTESRDVFVFYLLRVLDGLEAVRDWDEARRLALIAGLVPALRARGTQRLWSAVLPGVPDALARFREAGLRLVVVSNSDGTVESGLADAGLRPFFDAVLDSQVVGFEKPDPRIFRRALEISGADPARTLHVGDLYHADVVGARAAGVHALLLDPYGDWDDVDCARLPDLAALAERIARR
jgi:HAD superfamily hydrolase (TIGR01509 family)